jgi:hypothetical protein
MELEAALMQSGQTQEVKHITQHESGRVIASRSAPIIHAAVVLPSKICGKGVLDRNPCS